MPAGYSQTPLWKKLGLRAGSDLLLIDPPPGWSIAELPKDVSMGVESGGARQDSSPDVIVAFFGALEPLREAVPALGERIFPDGALWVAWPRRAGGHESDIREQDIRDLALPLGLVDVKVAALDEHWSGLRLLWRRERRQSSEAIRGG